MSFSSFEHKLLKIFKSQYQSLKTVWVSCSFGVDSLVLLEALKTINPVLGLDLNVLYVHHGDDERNKELSLYRDLAGEKVMSYCKQHNLNFKFFKSEERLESENEYREFRFSCYKELNLNKEKEKVKKEDLDNYKEKDKDKDEKDSNLKLSESFLRLPNILLGHHKLDYLETLMLKLIRGVGPGAFKFDDLITKDFNLLRPLMSFTKEEIMNEARLKGLNFLTDPTNESDEYLRNWLRNKWFKDLEKKRPGSLKVLSESLSLLSDQVSESESEKLNLYDVVSSEEKDGVRQSFIFMNQWLSLNHKQKESLVAQILHKNSDGDFSKGQISEVIKQLDLIKKEHRFSIAGLTWSKDQRSISFLKT